LYHKNLFMKALLEAVQPGDKDWGLVQAIDPTRLPAHIAVIMDGNGRWAGRRRLPRVAGHKAGIGPVRSTVETCARLGVKVLTLYAFSVENWKRPRAEVETLWRLLRYYLKHELPDLLPWMGGHGLPLMAYSPIEQGRIAKAGALAEIAAQRGVSHWQVALAWALRRPGAIVIPKASTEQHLRENLAAQALALSPSECARLDAQFPPPRRRQPLEML